MHANHLQPLSSLRLLLHVCRSWEVRPSLIAKARGKEEDCPAADAIAGVQGQAAGCAGEQLMTVPLEAVAACCLAGHVPNHL